MSEEINDGGPAFPTQQSALDPRASGFYTQDGMTLRDWLAGMALSGWLASYSADLIHPVDNDCHESVARMSYEMADAMIAARKGGVK